MSYTHNSVTCSGEVRLDHGLVLLQTLGVLDFHYNLIPITKLAWDNNYLVLFHAELCFTQGFASKELKGIAKQQGGLCICCILLKINYFNTKTYTTNFYYKFQYRVAFIASFAKMIHWDCGTKD